MCGAAAFEINCSFLQRHVTELAWTSMGAVWISSLPSKSDWGWNYFLKKCNMHFSAIKYITIISFG